MLEWCYLISQHASVDMMINFVAEKQRKQATGLIVSLRIIKYLKQNKTKKNKQKNLYNKKQLTRSALMSSPGRSTEKNRFSIVTSLGDRAGSYLYRNYYLRLDLVSPQHTVRPPEKLIGLRARSILLDVLTVET